MRFSGPQPIAHRGCTDVAPENTLAAFEAAVSYGMMGVEIDIRKTRDGQIIVFHDDTFERTTLGTKQQVHPRLVSDMTLEEVKKVKLPYAGHMLTYFPKNGYEKELWYYYPWEFGKGEGILSGQTDLRSDEQLKEVIVQCQGEYEQAWLDDQRYETIMTLEEFLLWLQKQPEYFFAEIEYKDASMTSEVMRLLEKTNTTRRCILFAGVTQYNEELQQWCRKNGKPHGLRLGANIRYCTPEILQSIVDYDLYEVGLNAGTFHDENIRYFKERGIAVFSNLGDYPQWWKKMNEMDVMAFKTNCRISYYEWWKTATDM